MAEEHLEGAPLYDREYKTHDFEMERSQLDVTSKRSMMSKYVKMFAEFKNMGANGTDYWLIHFFFSLIKKQKGEFAPNTGFWGNRNRIYHNLDKVRVLILDLQTTKNWYMPGDPFLDSILAPREYEKVTVGGRYVFLGWMMFKYSEPDQDNMLYVEYFDTFLRGLNLGHTMWKDFAQYSARKPLLVPYSVLQRSNSYFAKFDLWKMPAFQDPGDLRAFVGKLEYEDSTGFIREVERRRRDESEKEADNSDLGESPLKRLKVE